MLINCRRTCVVLLFAIAAASAATGSALHAQTIEELTATPESTAELFLRSVRAIRWSATAQFLHDDTLERFRLSVTQISDPDETGEIRTRLVQTDSLGLLALTPSEVFDRAIGTVIDDMPGLMHALYDRDDEVIGAVNENASSAHVVYRTTARISGAVSEVKVVQMGLSPSGWRVLWSDELEVLREALRGVGR